jgi:hypothetical protein
MTASDYYELPKRIDPVEMIEEVDVSPPQTDEGLPQPDKGWFASGG